MLSFVLDHGRELTGDDDSICYFCSYCFRFKERPGALPYNASEVVSIGDSRFLFCDNNISDALFEMRFTPEGELAAPLISHTMRGVHPQAIDDMECMAMAESDGQRLLFISSSYCLKKKDAAAKKKNRRGKLSAARESLIRVRISSQGRPEAEIIPCFRFWLVENSPVLGKSPCVPFVTEPSNDVF